jgi:Zn-dependent membrane protease YugP
MFFFSPLYIFLVLLPTIAITGWAAWRVRSAYGKWDRVDSGIDRDPLDFARYLLDRQGLTSVAVEPIPGRLTDNYDPRTRTLRISSAVAGQRNVGGYDPFGRTMSLPAQSTAPVGRLSVAAAAVIAHEVGHALQHAQNDPAMVARQAIVPVAQIGSSVAPWLIIAGLIFNLTGLAFAGLIFFAAAVLFTFATLPVEFGASNRALALVGQFGMYGDRQQGAREVLRAAGWTYVAGALTALLTFLYYLSLFSGRRD